MSLLAKIARHLSKANEVLATDALGAILGDAAAAGLLRQRLAAYAPGIPDALRFVTQSVGEDRTRPDVVGLQGDIEAVHVEGKFWAQLTPAQPNGYLARLARQNPAPAAGGPDPDPASPPHLGPQQFAGVLLFICPAGRVAELQAASCALANATPRPSTSEWLAADTASGQVVVITHW